MYSKWRSWSGKKKTLGIVNLTEEDILLSHKLSALTTLHALSWKDLAQSEYKAICFDHANRSKDIIYLSADSSWKELAYTTFSPDGNVYLSTNLASARTWELDLTRAHRPETWRGKCAWEGLELSNTATGMPPFRFYRFKVNRTHHRLVILPYRNLASFLSDIPSSMPLSNLVLPGTHDTLAFYGYPVSQCQSPTTPFAVQLQSGVRVFDLRFSIIDGALIAYHGASPQFTPYLTVLRILTDFLRSDAGRSETVICSIKQEDGAQGRFQLFSHLVRAGIHSPEVRDIWFLENRVPTLGEVRGKAILLSRFGDDGEGWDNGTEGMGIHPYTWPNSEKDGFSWVLKDTVVRTQDWYAIPTFLSIPEKFDRAVRLLEPPSNQLVDRELPGPPTVLGGLSRISTTSSESSSAPDPKYGPSPEKPAHELPHNLSITFFSAATFPLALPQTVALGFGWPQWNLGVEGVNARFGRWLLEKMAGDNVFPMNSGQPRAGQTDSEKRLSGWTLLDFYEWPLLEAGIVPLLVELNFIGRKWATGGGRIS
ncbi:PLC-like phosphodiesterase [Dacryopinax primogenitus]|uniref:PLC-like phosphodiesterase n=1 Tax=Dacryopinax primogenitus (strain DJM 731) TaxID=1858805 RepID=M5GAG8_DACPD|nr:PLC-like phosphodiesterase [Dacryopinax primogenitus]EJU05834.1 PLC-like phosphodiesterase [Dacryopinax primogenitus]